MRSPNQTYIPECDQLRAFAALLVLFYHSLYYAASATGSPGWRFGYDPVSLLLYEGHTGVALFMVLSGFILARGTLHKNLDYKQFIKNRLLRIMPLMTIVVVFAIYGSKVDSLSSALSPFLLMANTPLKFNDVTNLAGAIWAVSVEFQFYLIAPFLFAFVSKDGMRFLLPATVLVFIFKVLVLHAQSSPQDMVDVSYYTIVGRLNQFLIGIGLAYLYPHLSQIVETRHASLRWILFSISAACVTIYLFVLNHGGGWGQWHMWRYAQQEIEAYAWAGFIAMYLIVKPLRWRMISNAIERIGTWSFSTYILHWPLMILFWSSLSPWMTGTSDTAITAVNLFCLTPIILAVSALSFFCVEKPFLDLRGRYVASLGSGSSQPGRDGGSTPSRAA